MAASFKDDIYRLPNFGVDGALPPLHPWWISPPIPPTPPGPPPPPFPDRSKPFPYPLPPPQIPPSPNDVPPYPGSYLAPEHPARSAALDNLRWLLALLGANCGPSSNPDQSDGVNAAGNQRSLDEQSRSAVRVLSSPLLGIGSLNPKSTSRRPGK